MNMGQHKYNSSMQAMVVTTITTSIIIIGIVGERKPRVRIPKERDNCLNYGNL